MQGSWCSGELSDRAHRLGRARPEQRGRRVRHPHLALPAAGQQAAEPPGTDGAGLPIGIQFVGPPHHDGPVVAAAATLERALRP